MRNTKVLHILNSLQPSGAEVMLRVAAPHWHAHGVDVEILSVGQTTGSYAGELRAAGYPIHHLPFSKTPTFFWSLYQLLREGYEAVHIHTERGNFYYALTARLAGVGHIVRTIHNVFPTRAVRTLQRRLMRIFGCMQASVSASVAACELETFGNPTKQIPNWCDGSHFFPPTAAQRAAARDELKITDSEFAVISIGNCSAVKNHSELLKAIASLNRNDVTYLHVGQENDCDERQLASRLGIGQSARFMGMLRDVRTALYAADCFIMPSLHEGCGIAALEAMACGVPVVLANVPGLRDFAEISTDIIWTEPKAAEIAEGLKRAMKVDRSAIAARLSAAVRGRFDVERGVDAYVKLYRGEPMLTSSRQPLARPVASSANNIVVYGEATCC